MFVIANQATFRVGGKGGFTGAGKAEEHRNIAFLANVGGAVHRSDTFQRQQVVHHREHPFLHFAAVPGAANQLHALGQVKRHEVFGIQTLFFPLRVSALRAVHNDKVWFETCQLFIARANKHVFDKMRLPGHFGDETDGKTSIRVRTTESVDNEQTFAGKLPGHQAFQMLPGFRRERFVVVLTFAFVCPPESIASGIVTDDILIFW